MSWRGICIQLHNALLQAAPVLTPPPGTRFAKAKKRESRLKRAFKRSGAAQACGRWQGVLAGVEAQGWRAVCAAAMGSSSGRAGRYMEMAQPCCATFFWCLCRAGGRYAGSWGGARLPCQPAHWGAAAAGCRRRASCYGCARIGRSTGTGPAAAAGQPRCAAPAVGAAAGAC